MVIQMKDEEIISDEDFVNLGSLLRKDTDVIMHLKSLLDKEGEYSEFLGAVEGSIAENFIENRKLNDRDVIAMLKNVKRNYLQDISFFNEILEKDILLRLSVELQDRKITHHELKLVLDYVLWAIDNRSWMSSDHAYVEWIAYTFGYFSAKERKIYQEKFRKTGMQMGIPKAQVDAILSQDSDNLEIGDEESEHSKAESEFFALDDKEKSNFVLQNKEKHPFLIPMYAEELMERKDCHTAEKFLREVLDDMPEFPPAEILLGKVYMAMGNKVLAEHHLDNAKRMLDEIPDDVIPSESKEDIREEIALIMNNNSNPEGEDNFWAEGAFAETLGTEDIKSRMRTFHMKHDEEVNYDCKGCSKKISAHNKDWHDGMCDSCFDKRYHS